MRVTKVECACFGRKRSPVRVWAPRPAFPRTAILSSDAASAWRPEIVLTMAWRRPVRTKQGSVALGRWPGRGYTTVDRWGAGSAPFVQRTSWIGSLAVSTPRARFADAVPPPRRHGVSAVAASRDRDRRARLAASGGRRSLAPEPEERRDRSPACPSCGAGCSRTPPRPARDRSARGRRWRLRDPRKG